MFAKELGTTYYLPGKIECAKGCHELNRLESEGVLKKTTFSDMFSNIMDTSISVEITRSLSTLHLMLISTLFPN